MEARVLLSATPTATPDFRVFSPVVGTVQHYSNSGTTGLSPATLRQAYGMDLISEDGTGQTIAIVDAYNAPTIVADLHTFDVTYGLSDPTLTVVGQNGSSTLPGTDPMGKGNSWAVETSLDVEWAHAMAPGAKILLVEATSDSDTNLFAAINTARTYAGVSVVSMSWGGGESGSQLTYDSYFTTPAGHTGVTFVASSGDAGAYGSGGRRTAVNYPAASPNVLGVGGTTLTTDASGNWVSESAWGNGTSSGSLGGSGGGISQYEAQPAYQQGVVTQSTAFRAVPDVAADANPSTGVSIVDSWDFGTAAPWIKVGGTSLSAPVWAGVISVIDEARVAAGQGTFDGATQLLPALYAAPSRDFHDIATGSNGYAAAAGYDLVTGLGTPVVNNLVADLAGPQPARPIIGALAAVPPSVISGATITLNATGVRDTSASATITGVDFYMESNGTSGLQAGSDTLLGAGTLSGTTWSISTATTGFAAGTYTFYAVATDDALATSRAASTTLTIVQPTISKLTLSPTPVTAGTTITLSATGVQEAAGGTVAGVAFYLESNGTTGLQIGSDTLVGAGTRSGTTWTLTTPTTGFATGSYTYYAVATDSVGITSAVASAALSIVQPAGSNDSFAGGTILTGTTVSVTSSNVGATKEKGEPGIAGNAGGKSIWFTWTATANGRVSLDTAGSSFDTLLGVFTGNAVSALRLVASNDDAAYPRVLTSALTFNAVAGTTYHIAVDGYKAASGSVVLNLVETLAPANDNFASAALLTGTAATWTGSNVLATKEAGEPSVAGSRGGASIWFAWTPTASGTVNLDTLGSNFDTTLAVYTGASVSKLTTVADNDDAAYPNVLTSALTFNAVAGTTYYFSVDGYRGATGAVTLNLSEVVAAIVSRAAAVPTSGTVVVGGASYAVLPGAATLSGDLRH